MLKRFRLTHRKIGKNLSVEFNAGFFHAVHELRIGHAMLAGAGIDALNPQRPEIALPCATVAIGVLKVLLDALIAARRFLNVRASPWPA